MIYSMYGLDGKIRGCLKLLAVLYMVCVATMTLYLMTDHQYLHNIVMHNTSLLFYFKNETNITKINQQPIPMIFVITATYTRPVQKADLTRLAQTLCNVKRLHWIIVEDSKSVKLRWIDDLCSRLHMTCSHIMEPTVVKSVSRGAAQRNAGLDVVLKSNETGVIYFADDDNTYDLRIFEEMRYTKILSMWPVGLVTSRFVESPIVKDGRVTGFYTAWGGKRTFCIDMAGFAINAEKWRSTPVKFPVNMKSAGYLEETFLQEMKLERKDIEPKADLCTKILVWHTQTVKNPGRKIGTTHEKYKETNIDKLLM